MENTQVCAAAKREKGASAARKRSDVRYRQQRDAGDTTSDGERWKVTGGVRRGGRGVRRWSSGVGGSRGGGGGPRRGGRQTIRGGGNGRSSRTVLTGHKYGEAGKVNRRRLRRQRLRGGKREAHFTTSDAAAALLRQRRGEGGGRGGGSHQGKWNVTRVFLRPRRRSCTDSTLTCTADETLARERPSRSDSRLREITDDLGALAGAGETRAGPKTSRE